MIDASKYMPWRPLGEGPIYTGEQIWLPQLGAQAMAARTPVITGKTFIDCRIEGPAVLAALGACEFDACDLGYSSGDIRNLLLGPVGEKITGAVVFQECKFQRCAFFAVGFTGAPAFLKQFEGIRTGPK